MTQKEQIRYIEQCLAKSRANPRKTVKVAPGCYYLTVNGYLWHIVYCGEINRWHCYTNDARDMELDETRTKREQIDCLLS